MIKIKGKMGRIIIAEGMGVPTFPSIPQIPKGGIPNNPKTRVNINIRVKVILKLIFLILCELIKILTIKPTKAPVKINKSMKITTS